jgi:thiamine biosynthesis lipoprotein
MISRLRLLPSEVKVRATWRVLEMPKAFVLFILLTACTGNKPQIIKNNKVGAALGTSYSIIYLADLELDFQTEIDSVFDAVNRSMSTYIPTSDISKINKGDSTLMVDQMFREVFELSKEIHQSTNGFFDPTVGTLVNAWGFGPGEQIELDSTKVDSLLSYVGFEKVAMTEGRTIKKKHKEIKFDFNAIAKGYAVDRMAHMLDEKGISDYLIEVGGELVAKGENTLKKKSWLVGIDDPQGEDRGNPIKLIYLRDKAMATSGNYRKFRIDPDTGEKYVHTVDPQTGYTKNSKTLGATVLAETCARADGFTTAFMAMNLEEAKKILMAQNELDAYIIYLDNNNIAQEFMTEGFKRVIAE